MGTNWKAFGEIQTPADLVKKLAFDLERMKDSTQDHYAAFDFFVTAEHIVDWLHPTDRVAQKNLRDSSILLQVISHLGNGAKHFHATRGGHKTVTGMHEEPYAEDYVEEGYVKDSLCVDLDPTEAAALGSTRMPVVELAQRVLEYWQASPLIGMKKTVVNP
jgi:hypothetical protein